MYNPDHSRHFLLSSFSCADCGASLTIARLKQDGLKVADCPSEGGLTGGERVQNIVYIHPCKSCLAPVNDVKNALKTLMGHADKERGL